jgi:hypothetical protein
MARAQIVGLNIRSKRVSINICFENLGSTYSHHIMLDELLAFFFFFNDDENLANFPKQST